MRDVDAPSLPRSSKGLLVRWNPETQPQGGSIAQWFSGIGFIVERGHNMPSNSAPTEIWIDIGPGMLWEKQP
jgi:hypothetical protein